MYFRTGLRPWNPTRYEVQAEKALFARFSPQTKVSRPGNPVSEKEREKLIAQGHAKRSERAAGRQAGEEAYGEEYACADNKKRGISYESPIQTAAGPTRTQLLALHHLTRLRNGAAGGSPSTNISNCLEVLIGQ